MLRRCLIAACVALALGLWSFAAAESASVLLEKGIYYEETVGDLDAAIKIYEQIAADAEANRRYVAQAYYRMGLCHEKRGEKERAAEMFRKVVSLYPEQKELAEKAKTHLAKFPRRPDWVPLNEVIERVVNDVDESRTNAALDFETGKLLPVPEEINDDDQALIWAKKQGADFVGDSSGGNIGGAGVAMAVMEVDRDTWEADLTAEELDSTVGLATVEQAQLAEIDAHQDLLPRTFALRTREGSVGLMQIVGGEKERIYLRYRLLAYGAKAESPLPAVAPQDWVPLDTMIELAFPPSMIDKCIDLETGKMVTVPKNFHGLDHEQRLAWAVNRGVELYKRDGSYMQIALVDDALWNEADAGTVREMYLPSPKAPPYHAIWNLAEQVPATYAFRTMEGSLGVLQYVRREEDDKVGIRYKLLAYGTKPDRDVSGSAVPLGRLPLNEVVVRWLRDEGEDVLDFETGKLLWPPEWAKNSEGILLWARESGGDFAAETNPEFLGGAGLDVAALPVDESRWEDGDLDRINEELFYVANSPLSLVGMGRLPVTYAFRTREGSVGVMQITWAEEARLRLRYKLLAYGQEGASSFAKLVPPGEDWAPLGAEGKFRASNDSGRPQTFVDFERGKLIEEPQGLASLGERIMWARESGADFSTDFSTEGGQKPLGGVGFDMVALYMTPRHWEHATLDGFNKDLRHAANSPHAIVGRGQVPATYAFRTREGTVGVMRIEKLEEREIHLRYKLLGYGQEAESSSTAVAPQALCKNDLKQIGIALHVYAADHVGQFPREERPVEAFWELLPGYLNTARVFVCPGAKADVEAWERTEELTEETCSYGWVAGLGTDSPGDFILAFDKSPDHHGGGRNVLFVDGHVEFMKEDEFQKKMVQQREKMKAGEKDSSAVEEKE